MEYDLKEKDTAIEKIAWELFLRNTGFRFIRELSPEEKRKITDVESFEYYREKAVKVYEKKLRSLGNKKYPVIDVPSSGKRNWMGGAYTLCFVYSKYNGNFVLRGYRKEVEEYLKQNFTHYFCNHSLWHKGFNRDIWDFWKNEIGIFHPSIKERKKGKKIEVRKYSNYQTEDEFRRTIPLKFKRLPKRWIPLFDVL